MWDLVPRPGIDTGPPALGAQSLGHGTRRKVPPSSSFMSPPGPQFQPCLSTAWLTSQSGRGINAGWHHRLDGHEFEQALGVGDGQGSLAWIADSDSTERLN